MKIMTILGTRPEIIRLSRVIPKLDQLCEHRLIHTGQNYDPRLSDIFFKQLGVREPDRYLGVQGSSFAEQIGQILVESEKVLRTEHPDRLLILGDTNSGLAAIIAKRMGIPVYHMEEGNRRLIDHSSDVLMPYTERSRANLLREGIAGHHIYVTGNPIKEVLDFYEPQIDASSILEDLELQPQKYYLVTLHRAENVDVPERLAQFVEAFDQLHAEYNIPVICSLHPRTRSQLVRQSTEMESKGIRTYEPFGFFDFVKLEKQALCVLSDSGTVQEECCIFGVPNVTIRDVTERPETIEAGSNILSGAAPENILHCVRVVASRAPHWRAPSEYLAADVSQTISKIVTGYLHL
jgi:UDP-N-acetylglucosamine 2-epimerase (non-hydrolysing)